MRDLDYDLVSTTFGSVQLKRWGKVVLEFRCDEPSGAITTLEDFFYDLRSAAADEAICDYIDSEAMNASFHSE